VAAYGAGADSDTFEFLFLAMSAPALLLGPTSAVQSASAREAEARTLEFVRNDEPTIDGRFTEAGKSDYRSRSACGQTLTPPAASGGRPAQYNRIHLARDDDNLARQGDRREQQAAG